jgi:hypothetical protein
LRKVKRGSRLIVEERATTTPGTDPELDPQVRTDGRTERRGSVAVISPAPTNSGSGVASRPVDSISRLILVETVISSEDRGWRDLEASRFRYATEGFYLPGFACHAVVIHLGPTAELVEREGGRLHRALVRWGDVSVVPAGLESEWWWQNGREVDRLHTYLDPAVFRRVAAEAGAEPGRVEVLNSVAVRDPLLKQTGMALLEELDAGGLAGRCTSSPWPRRFLCTCSGATPRSAVAAREDWNRGAPDDSLRTRYGP